MKTRALVLVGAAAVLFCSAPVLAQQPAPESQREDEDVPTLTTQDVRPVEGQPAGAQTEAPPPEDPSLTPEERADVEAGGEAPADKGAGPAKKKGPSAAELAWRQQYAAAESQARAAEKRAQEAELRSNDLRNQLATAGSSSARNDLAAQLDQQGSVARQAREEANAARATLDRLRAEGSRRHYQPAAGPAATTNGRPNPSYHQQRVARAKADLDDANRRIEIYQARVNDARGRILNNSGSGDNYAQARIQTDLDDALKELQRAQTDQQAAQSRYDAAVNAARQAGVPVQQ
jgi:hypothetical protein